ncbi:DNA polymerase type-B family catalytic domain containing protein [Ceratobasidium theobromae]|uniref:DNA polymerase n=1 Tax=Ceratobasidium theobromae TaxID=1582974 RepID=A0A5N5QTS1_9AGAM|nr:DNA polymerase type-B family catalytic domain containing protein [Ceratobasidium theobromae]
MADSTVGSSRKRSEDETKMATKKRKVDNGLTAKKSFTGSQSLAETQGSSFVEILEQFEDGDAPAEGGQNLWPRPELKKFDPKTTPIIFQQIDIEEFPDSSGNVLRLFGVTTEGHSVLAHVTHFLPYFYIAMPRGFDPNETRSLMEHLNGQTITGAVVRIECIQKRSLWSYRLNARGMDETSPFLKIILADPRSLPKVRDEYTLPQLLDYNLSTSFIYASLSAASIVGMNWIEVPGGSYQLRNNDRKVSTCQLEFDVRFDAFISHAPDGEWSKIAPLRILSFDIECAGRKGIFPEATMDPVIQIANMVTTQGETAPFIRNVFTLNDCAHIVGTDVISFKKEDAMLLAWRKFVDEVDPDVVIGYNIAGFDLPYLLDRARALKGAANEFPFLGRLKSAFFQFTSLTELTFRLLDIKTATKDTHFSSKAFGQRDSKETQLNGRLQLDMLQYMQREQKLRSYTLNAVCAHFLGEQKEDVHHSVITDLQNGSPESRRRLAVYCLKDAYLPQRLMDKLMCFVNYTEMARVTGVPFNYLLQKGQQIKVISQLYRKANADGYVIPNMKSEGKSIYTIAKYYPKLSFQAPTSNTKELRSLYPSIMMAHNLCYTTLVYKETIDQHKLVKGEDYIQTPNNDFFVTSKRRKGLLPTVLEDLISARKRAKADLKKETDPFKRAVLDGRQLALKISANSVYGFTGATIGRLPCLAISSSVTAYGREMIERTKLEVETEYCIKNGRQYDAEVIYGDTDSVMIKFGTQDLESTMALGTCALAGCSSPKADDISGAEAAEYVTTKFVQPIKLEFEKVYFPYLLISKKRYAGLYWTNPKKYDKMDAKGIETVRRDNCRLVQTVIDTCLRKMLIDRDVKGAEEYTKQTIADLLQNRVDMSQLVITKALAKAGKLKPCLFQAHVELAERMKKRDAGSAPALGDRVAYVIVKAAKGAAAYEKSEDPLYVLDNSIPIDTKYYLDNQLSKPLMRIFEPILGEKAANTLRSHTRTIQIATPTIGGLMKFAVKTVTCLGCKTPLRANNSNMGAVCNNCRPRLMELYYKQTRQTSDLQVAFARLWTQCQRCQGSLHQEVLCTSKDCPIFYMRKKAQKDVEESVAVLDRFANETW